MDITHLLGRSKDEKAVVDLLTQFGEPVFLDAPYRQYWSFSNQGFTILFNTETNKIITVFLYSSRYGHNFSQYLGVLPRNLSFSDKREDVQELFGRTVRSRERLDVQKGKLYMDQYEEENRLSSFHFDVQGRLEMVTLSLLSDP